MLSPTFLLVACVVTWHVARPGRTLSVPVRPVHGGHTASSAHRSHPVEHTCFSERSHVPCEVPLCLRAQFRFFEVRERVKYWF